MSVGSKIRKFRLEGKLTQQELANRTGMAVSYLSRLENNRIAPTTKTLTKVAQAMNIPASSFFDKEPILEAGDRCPISASGKCALDQRMVHRGRRPSDNWESYEPEQLKALKLCDYLIHTGDNDIVNTLTTMLESLLALATTKKVEIPGIYELED